MLWIIQWLPEGLLAVIINAAILVGALGLLLASFLKMIPFVNIYRIWIQLICVVLLAGGIYWKGAYEIEMTWRKRVEDLEKKVAEAEQKSQQINTKIVTQVVTRVQKHTEYRDRIKKEIEIQREYIDRECKLNPQAVELYNKAVLGEQK